MPDPAQAAVTGLTSSTTEPDGRLSHDVPTDTWWRSTSGYLIDVTDAILRDLAAATRIAVEQSAATRASIDQAKGALMITYGLNEDEAFAMLRWHSQHSNIKLRDIAAAITDRTSDPDLAGLTAAGRITEILAGLTHRPPPPTPKPIRRQG